MIFSRRRYQIKEEDREFLDYLPPVSVFLGGIVFFTGTILAILLYHTKQGNYQFFDQFFSELGLRHNYIADLGNGMTEQRYAPEYPDIFNITLYAAGFLMMPFFFFSYRQMRNSNRLSNFFLIFAITCGVLTGPLMIGVGVFDLSSSTGEIWMTHGFWVANLYLFISMTSIFWFLMLIFSSHLPYHTSKIIGVDYFLLIILVGLIIINILDNLLILPVKDIPYLGSFSIEFYQKLIAYVFFMYYGLLVGGRLSKTKYDNTPVVAKAESRGSVDRLFCTNCGNENPKSAPFCSDCGVKLSY